MSSASRKHKGSKRTQREREEEPDRPQKRSSLKRAVPITRAVPGATSKDLAAVKLPVGLLPQGDSTDFEFVNEKCLKGYQIKQILGQGTYGSVANVCLKDDCDYAVKMMRSENVNQDEISIIKTLSEQGIGAKFIGTWECPALTRPRHNVRLVVMEKWDGELPVGVCLPIKVLKRLCQEIEKLHELGLVHGDLLEKNVLVKKTRDGLITDATLSDFGTVETKENWKRNERRDFDGNGNGQITTFYNYHKAAGLKGYYDHNRITLEKVRENPEYLDKALMWKLYRLCNIADPDNCESLKEPSGWWSWLGWN